MTPELQPLANWLLSAHLTLTGHDAILDTMNERVREGLAEAYQEALVAYGRAALQTLHTTEDLTHAHVRVTYQPPADLTAGWGVMMTSTDQEHANQEPAAVAEVIRTLSWLAQAGVLLDDLTWDMLPIVTEQHDNLVGRLARLVRDAIPLMLDGEVTSIGDYRDRTNRWVERARLVLQEG